MAKRSYLKDSLEVGWDSSKCMHAKKCWKELPQVFDPRNKPWINLDGASEEEIIKQVKSCPSGALSLPKQILNTTNMKLNVAKNGPILISEACEITLANGETKKTDGPVALCRCGHSKNKPFCDGGHKKEGFNPDA